MRSDVKFLVCLVSEGSGGAVVLPAPVGGGDKGRGRPAPSLPLRDRVDLTRGARQRVRSRLRGRTRRAHRPARPVHPAHGQLGGTGRWASVDARNIRC